MALRDVYRMAVFAKIAEKGSVSAAAADMGLSKSAVSQQLAKLEDRLGVRLISRNTRSLKLTQEGRAYYARCARMVREAEMADDVILSSREEAAGKVRLTAPYNLGLISVVPALPDFRRRYPEIEVDLILEDRILNMIDEGLDVSLRSGWLKDTALYAVTLASMRMIVCCSADYAARRTPPARPEDLIDHDWIGISSVAHPDRVLLENDAGERRAAPLRTMLRSNSGYAARSLILRGVGVGMLPDYSCRDLIASGALMRVCAPWRSREGTISAVFPSRDHMTKRGRLLVDFLKETLIPKTRDGLALLNS